VSFTLEMERRDVATTIVLGGELDMASAPRLQAVIAALIARGEYCILVDLYQLAFCDSAGLNAFVQGDKHCAARGGWLRVIRAQGHVARVLELSGVGEVLGYRRDEVHSRLGESADAGQRAADD
jgi:anti-sigma B factor antagonist